MTGERIVIAGAGPVGVIAAILLARRGMPSLIIERHAEPYGLPRAVHIDDEVFRALQDVGIAEEFAARPGTLLVVCGSEDSVEEELWARQLGAWVYLPGVSSGDALVSLFAEARRVADRRGAWQLV